MLEANITSKTLLAAISVTDISYSKLMPKHSRLVCLNMDILQEKRISVSVQPIKSAAA